MTEREIFTAALAREVRAEQVAFLDEACAGDTALRERVESLLAEHQQLGSFMNVPSPAAAKTVDMPGAPLVAERPGTVIGPYKLLQEIGQGGMGVVYMAEQAAPVRRKVALKIIKPGLDTREVIARFEAERQALALMDHSNIARVFDGGATEAGRPYFVMELVRGVPITDYCDQNNLPIHERLELFVTVCHAVQHAHQKGIIHRDIKPSNVLVTMHDGRPIPKVIDFGVAKAIGQQLTDKTLFTQFAQMVGTPLYMSPEQAELTGQDVDTRGDIYSLGVLLYELLTGTTPFEGGRMKKAAIDEIRRMIREEDPPSPSVRLSSTAGEAQTAVAAHRHIDPKGLSRLVRGDLDWIVMKALEKDRTRRYETADGFAADIGRNLSDEPILARPPSTIYWLRKFVRRRKGLVLASTIVLAALVLGIVGTTMGLLRARDERDKVLAAQEKTLAAQNKERLALIEAEENLQTARDAVDKMYTRAAEEMRDKPQVEQIRRALLEDALRFYQQFLKRKGEDRSVRYEAALSQRRVGEIFGFLGDWTKSLENHRRATEMLIALSPEFANDVRYRDELARAHFHSGHALMALLRLDDGTASLQEAIALWEPLTIEFPDTPSYLEDLAHANYLLGRGWARNYSVKGSANVTLGLELLAQLKLRFPGHEISSSFKLATNDLAVGRYTNLPHDAATLKQLEQECRDQLAVAEAEARDHPDAPQYQNQVASWLGRLCNPLVAMERFEELEQIGARALEIQKRLAAQHPETPAYQTNLAWAEYNTGMLLHFTDRPDEAVDHYRAAIAIMSELVRRFPENLRNLNHLAGMIRQCPAVPVRDPLRALELSQRLNDMGGDPAWHNLAMSQVEAGQYQEALESCQKASLAGKPSGFITYATAVAYWHLGKQDEARELARQIILKSGSEPNQYWYIPEVRLKHCELAKLMGLDFDQRKASDPEKVLRNGIALYRKQIAERPGEPGLLQELARCYTELSRLLSGGGRNDEADETIRQAVAEWEKLAAESPRNVACRMHLGSTRSQLASALVRQGKPDDAAVEWEKAVAEYTKAITLAPADSWAWTGRAFVHFHKKKWDESISDFSKAIELAPLVHTNWWHRGHCYINLAQWDQAATEFEQIVGQWPDGIEGWYLHAVSLAHLNQPERAMAGLRQLIVHGFCNVEQIRNNPHFASLRAREDFRELLDELEQKENAKNQ